MRIDPPSPDERAVIADALRTLASRHSRIADGPLHAALFVARAEEVARDLCVELVHDARDATHLTWADIGTAFGMTMQSAHWRFTRPARPPISRLRR